MNPKKVFHSIILYMGRTLGNMTSPLEFYVYLKKKKNIAQVIDIMMIKRKENDTCEKR